MPDIWQEEEARYQIEMQRRQWEEQRRMYAAQQRYYDALARRVYPQPDLRTIKLSDVLKALGLTVKRRSSGQMDVSHPKGRHKVVVDCGDSHALDIADAYASGIYLVVMQGKYPACGFSFGGVNVADYRMELKDLPKASDYLRFHWGRLHEEDPAWASVEQASRYAIGQLGERLDAQRVADAREAQMFLIKRRNNSLLFKRVITGAICGVLVGQVIMLVITHI